MKSYKVRYNQQDVTVNLHSDASIFVGLCLEKCLSFFDEIGSDKYTLSQFGHGSILFLVHKDESGYIVDFCEREDYELGKVDEQVADEISKLEGRKPVKANVFVQTLNGRQRMPWDV